MLRSPSRRRWIRAAVLGVAATPFILRWSSPALADETPPLLDENSTTGKALGYVADASKVDVVAHPKFKPGQTCRNCSQYLGEAGDKAGGCTLVLGQFVLADAWCNSWELKTDVK